MTDTGVYFDSSSSFEDWVVLISEVLVFLQIITLSLFIIDNLVNYTYYKTVQNQIRNTGQ